MGSQLTVVVRDATRRCFSFPSHTARYLALNGGLDDEGDRV